MEEQRKKAKPNGCEEEGRIFFFLIKQENFFLHKPDNPVLSLLDARPSVQLRFLRKYRSV